MSAKSLLYADDAVYGDPPDCQFGRVEVPLTFQKNGRLYKFVARDKITVEDPYLVFVKASAFAIRTGEPYAAQVPTRAVRDFLVKTNVGS